MNLERELEEALWRARKFSLFPPWCAEDTKTHCTHA